MDTVQQLQAIRSGDRLYIESLIAGRLAEATHYLERLKTSDLWTKVGKDNYVVACQNHQAEVDYLHGLLDRFRLGEV